MACIVMVMVIVIGRGRYMTKLDPCVEKEHVFEIHEDYCRIGGGSLFSVTVTACVIMPFRLVLTILDPESGLILMI